MTSTEGGATIAARGRRLNARDDRVDEVAARGIDAAHGIGLGLGDEVSSTERESFHGLLRALSRQGRGHDNASVGRKATEMREGGEAIHVRHLDIENDDVRLCGSGLSDGLLSVGTDLHQIDARVFIDPAAHEATHDCAVVHQHDADATV
jgi:hypothetical protein